jgi:hypothetical protein
MWLLKTLLGCALGLALAPALARPAAVASPLNGLPLVQPAEGDEYTLWLVGHSYGQTVYPVASLLLNLDEINRSGARALVLLGDAVRSPTPVHVRNLRKLSEQLEMPVFIAPGNHDTRDPEAYERAFGRTYYDFRIGHDLYVVLYLNLHWDAVSPEQLDWFRERMELAAADAEVRNVIILSHHLVWSVDDPRLQVVRSRITFPPDYREGFYAERVQPIVDGIAARKPVYWVSGDRTSFPPFFWKVPERNVTYLAVGMKDHPADSIIELRSKPSSGIRFRLVSLSGLDLGPIEQYGPEFWEAYYTGRARILSLREPLDLKYVALVDAWMFITNRRFIMGALLSSAATAGLIGLGWALYRWRHREARS